MAKVYIIFTLGSWVFLIDVDDSIFYGELVITVERRSMNQHLNDNENLKT